ncbi:protein-methionine-sulfoxide reductase catalytic subunit MsrP [Roseospirillum parvum]|uniref:Protein-methionine-sulfoxide reductase catalytic subunit MsrP n=1 Tax=Roseospirillum parvum TaxID=83401 RepID=A0A1G7UF27_9PROT|nr:protein-methionine-sulfoxide reductase catalytic subunit MsrP [Roseospirillum parvum]SDG45380.1 sulfoxide reductase catalytic subunit YedY [Roseospirillum parvum]
MPVHRRSPWSLPDSEVTPPALFRARRRFLKAGAGSLALSAGLASGLGGWVGAARAAVERPGKLAPLEVTGTTHRVDEALTDYEAVTTYNNFYEFGAGKEDPAENAHTLKPRPWTLSVDGLVARPRTFDVADLLATQPLEERIYRLRCVEAWSMVIPWIGFPLAALLDRVEPLGSARYVRFESLIDDERMPPRNRAPISYPYVEGLRLDEARHDLTLLAVGLYGEVLPNQSGAPIRLVVPWKYGFKSIKSVVRISLVEDRPLNTWQALQPSEYGFYANVNPEVDHPRWSQARERRIGEFFRRETLMFNGYGEAVADLYRDLDLTKWY